MSADLHDEVINRWWLCPSLIHFNESLPISTERHCRLWGKPCLVAVWARAPRENHAGVLGQRRLPHMRRPSVVIQYDSVPVSCWRRLRSRGKRAASTLHKAEPLRSSGRAGPLPGPACIAGVQISQGLARVHPRREWHPGACEKSTEKRSEKAGILLIGEWIEWLRWARELEGQRSSHIGQEQPATAWTQTAAETRGRKWRHDGLEDHFGKNYRVNASVGIAHGDSVPGSECYG